MSLKDFSKQEHIVITTLGLEFAVAQALGVLLGFWLDKKWGTSPVFIIVGTLAGFAFGFYIVWRFAKTHENWPKVKTIKKRTHERR